MSLVPSGEIQASWVHRGWMVGTRQAGKEGQDREGKESPRINTLLLSFSYYGLDLPPLPPPNLPSLGLTLSRRSLAMKEAIVFCEHINIQTITSHIDRGCYCLETLRILRLEVLTCILKINKPQNTIFS